jgi:transposase
MTGLPQRVELDLDELKRIVTQDTLSAADREKLLCAVETLAFLTQALENRNISLARMRKMLFGASTEKTSLVCGQSELAAADDSTAASTETEALESSTAADGETRSEEQAKPKRKGHGRNGADRYRGAQHIPVHHPSLCPGDGCPLCRVGKVYPMGVPRKLVRLTGQAPIIAKIWELERLRCNACGEVFSAQAPDDVGPDKYDASASAMVAIAKYGTGLPFYRLAGLEQGMGIPLPPATQWQVVTARIAAPQAVHRELIRIAAQGQVLHNDDTGAKILALMKGKKAAATDDAANSEERTGIFTSGIVALHDGQRIALYFTGHQHAGENLADVLRLRPTTLGAPIHMCDALSRNLPKDFETILVHCMAHCRRNFVDVLDNFKTECRYVLEVLRDVYHNDAIARQRNLSAEQRLAWHQAESKSLMDGLEKWIEAQLKENKVEPNSGLGQAIKYMQKHWHALTQFLRVPGAPLDNNVCEQILKKAILHRKNAYFFKTQRGAEVGDIYMSLIRTAELCRASPFDYLCAIMMNVERVLACPSQWLPWNYQLALQPSG